MKIDPVKQGSSAGKARKRKRRRDIGLIVADLKAFHKQMVERHGYLPDSLEAIRELRREG